jgi:hypothetical protein
MNGTNPKVLDIIQQANEAVLNPTVVQASGAGKAYQSVAQSSAIAIQDATDALRNISTVATTAAGVIVAQMIAGDDKNADLLPQIQQLMTGAIQDYASIGAQATAILTNFPSH